MRPPPIFEYLTPLPQGPMDPTGGGGTSAYKTAKMQKFPIDSHSNENLICPFFPPPGAANGEKTHPEPEYARMRTLAWIGPRVVKKSLTEQKTTKKHTVTPNERMAGNKNVNERSMASRFNIYSRIEDIWTVTNNNNVKV